MIIYTVNEGDTLFSIAAANNTTASRIAADNRIAPDIPLVVGQTLVLLYPETLYTAREGDTVLSIARLFNTSAVKIWQNNPILEGKNAVYPGQSIVISYGAPELSEKSIGGYAYTYIDDDLLRRTLPYMTYLSVFPYGLTEGGDLISPEGDERLIRTAKEYNTVPLLSLTSLTEEGVFSSPLVDSILSNRELRTRVIENTVNAVFEKGFGGVDMDFEFIDPELADAYAQFITELKNSLGEGFVVFADLAPKTYRTQPGLLYEAHDYPMLGSSADKLFLMTYEWGYMYGPPLAVSPIENVRSVIEYAVSEIPPEKLFMGIPSYGYDWSLPFIQGETRAETLSSEEAVDLARRYNAVIQYDTEYMAPYFYYVKDSVQHVVWFQNARSADSLARLAEEYSLDGINVWNVMRRFPNLWQVLLSLFPIRKLI